MEEYRTLLASGSDTIELSTENGKIIICRKQAKEMEEYLGQAEILLGDVVQSRDISTLVVLHHLRNLAEVLDNLKLYDECRLTGNCALDLAEALSRRSLEFKQEQADTLALIAGLDAYEPRARTLFVQAVLICDEVVENDASHSNKYSLLYVLGRASSCVLDNAQWLERAVQLMTKEIPPTMVNPDFRSSVYTIYGNSLRRFDQYAHATEAYYESISIRRPLVNSNPAKHSYHFAQTLYNMGSTFHDLGEYGGAIAAYKEQLDICTVMSAQDPPRYNELMAITLIRYEDALRSLKRLPEAAAVEKQALSFCRKLAQTDDSWRDQLCAALYNYGFSCYSLGNHAEAVLAYQESILLRRVRVVTHPEEEISLRRALHNISNSFNALGKRGEANAAAMEALERNHWRAFDRCFYPPNLRSCFVCQKVMM